MIDINVFVSNISATHLLSVTNTLCVPPASRLADLQAAGSDGGSSSSRTAAPTHQPAWLLIMDYFHGANRRIHLHRRKKKNGEHCK